MILADQTMLFIGSQNLTATSLDDNREIGTVDLRPHAIARVLDVFEFDLAKAIPEENRRRLSVATGRRGGHRKRQRAGAPWQCEGH